MFSKIRCVFFNLLFDSRVAACVFSYIFVFWVFHCVLLCFDCVLLCCYCVLLRFIVFYWVVYCFYIVSILFLCCFSVTIEIYKIEKFRNIEYIYNHLKTYNVDLNYIFQYFKNCLKYKLNMFNIIFLGKTAFC